jgi:CubicO group peptidase (beta-lactamase class C family)
MKNSIQYFLIVIFILPLLSRGQNPSLNKQDIRFDRIDSLFREQSKFQTSTGIAVAIVKDNSILYNKGFGYSNLLTRDTVTEMTMFHLGSIPKSFVAVALMQLVEQKKVNLDSLVIKYIPELKFKDPRYRKITVRHLATHTSGIFTNRNHDWDKPKNSDDALDKFVLSLDYNALRFDPGEKLSYSDFNYDIIGDIIYRVTGVPFEDYMKNNILQPSGMTKSTFYLPDTNTVARPYIDDYEKCKISRGFLYPVNREHAPCGTLFSNTTEMCYWMMMNISKGKFGDKNIIKKETYDLLWKPQKKTGWGSNYYESMAIGWFVGNYNGKTTYLHSGTDHGYRAIFCIIPEDKYGIVILSNYRETPIHYLLDRTLSNLYGVYFFDTSFDLITKDEYPMIVGEYSDTAKNSVTITRKYDFLYFNFNNYSCCLSSIREGNIMAGQYYENQNLPFYYDQANVYLSKEATENKKVKYVINLFNMRFEKK